MPLVVCATPIGNLEDVTLRVLRELGEADVVLCEDTRRTRTLLDRHGIEARLVSYHQHNEARRVQELLPRLEAGERIALATDAGLPGVSDPGARLISAAIDRGVEVTVLPGPSVELSEPDLADEHVMLRRSVHVFDGDGVNGSLEPWVGAVSPDDGVVVASGCGPGLGGAAGHGEDEGSVEGCDLGACDVRSDVGVAVQPGKAKGLGHVEAP